MWQRNLLFASIVIVGLLVLGGSLFSTARHAQPEQVSLPPKQADSIRSLVAKIDQEFADSWKEAGLEAAEKADTLKIARRLSLALCGTVPSLEEIRTLEGINEDRQLDWWLAHLLEDQRYGDYVAERLTRAFVGVENGPFLLYRRRRFLLWLSEQIQEKRRYDAIVREMISEEGLWTDRPAVNFVTATLDDNNKNRPDPIRLAGRVSRAFLGMRIDCLQCHDDQLEQIYVGESNKLRTGLQTDFHQLAAFFGKTEVSVFGINDSKKKNKEYEYKYLGEDEEVVVDPSVPFSKELLAEHGSRRAQLARWVTHKDNKAFARATVNRTWAILFGKALVDPVDDIPLEGPYPPGLELLADDFIANDFSLSRLIRVIATLRVFQIDSRAAFDVSDQHEAAWAVFPLVRLRPEQVGGSLIQASRLSTIDADSTIVAKLMRFGQESEFVKRYGDRGEDEFGEHAGTITQRLLMMNGNLVKELTEPNIAFNASTRISIVSSSDANAVETAYLCILSRRPSQRELDQFEARLEGLKGNARQRMLEDICWVLLNSSEFSWNH